jgi:hypothetical protein
MKQIIIYCDICGDEIKNGLWYQINLTTTVFSTPKDGGAPLRRDSKEYPEQHVNECCNNCIKDIYKLLKPQLSTTEN